jgi:SpoVK/Ycf46/Vps4 family AAA+-type ATPase
MIANNNNMNNNMNQFNNMNQMQMNQMQINQMQMPNEMNKGITLSGLLNALDGIFTTNGRILIMTTNKPEVLDDALIRPGRCDVKYKFDNCNKQQIQELYEIFFNQSAQHNQLNKIKNKQYSPAHITSVFLRYRNEPHNALLHLDDIEQKIVITPLVEVEEEIVEEIIEEKQETNKPEVNNNIELFLSNDLIKEQIVSTAKAEEVIELEVKQNKNDKISTTSIKRRRRPKKNINIYS